MPYTKPDINRASAQAPRSGANAHHRPEQALSQNHADQLMALGSQAETNTKLATPKTDAVGRHAVNADELSAKASSANIASKMV